MWDIGAFDSTWHHGFEELSLQRLLLFFLIFNLNYRATSWFEVLKSIELFLPSIYIEENSNLTVAMTRFSWPGDLTLGHIDLIFSGNVYKRCPTSYVKFGGAVRRCFFSICEKPQRSYITPPCTFVLSGPIAQMCTIILFYLKPAYSDDDATSKDINLVVVILQYIPWA